jgi:hypothetical protein
MSRRLKVNSTASASSSLNRMQKCLTEVAGTSETKEVKWEDVEFGARGTRSDFTDSQRSVG